MDIFLRMVTEKSIYRKFRISKLFFVKLSSLFNQEIGGRGGREEGYGREWERVGGGTFP